MCLPSNIGHLLWSGIVDDDKIDACVRHRMGERLVSGWRSLELTGIPGRWERSDAFGRARLRMAERQPELAVRI